MTGADGRGWAPDDAWRHADDAFDRKVRPFEMTYFHARGSATLTLPAGRYTVLATHGLEYAPVTQTGEVAAGAGWHGERASSSASMTCPRAAGGAATCTST